MPPNLLALFLTACQGNKQALAELVTHLVNPLRCFAYTLVENWNDADEVAQEALLSLVKVVQNASRRQSFEDQDGFLNYLFTIVRNQCRRLQKRQGRYPCEDDPFGEDLLNLFDPTVPNEDCQVVLEKVETLPEVDRELFALYLEGYTSAQIRDILQLISDSTVRSKWRKVCQRLRAALPDLVLKYQLRD